MHMHDTRLQLALYWPLDHTLMLYSTLFHIIILTSIWSLYFISLSLWCSSADTRLQEKDRRIESGESVYVLIFFMDVMFSLTEHCTVP